MNTTREIVEIGASIVVGVIGLLATSHFTCRKRVENLLPVSRNHIDDNRLPLVQASADRQIDNNTQEVQLVPASPNVPPAQQLMEMDTRGKSAINGNGGTANYNQILKISVMVAGIIVIVIGLFTAYHFTCESGNVKGLFKPDPNGNNTQDDESVPARHLQEESHAKELMEMDIRGKSAINEIINTTREIMNITTEIIIRNSDEDKILKIVEIVVDIVVGVLELLGAVLAILAASHYTCRRLVENLLPVSRNHIDDNRLPLVQASADRQIDNNTQEVQLVPASLNVPPAQQTQEVQLVPASPNVPPAHQTQEVQLVLASPNVPPAQQIKKVNPYSDSVSDDDTREGKESKKRHKPKKSDDEDEDDKKGKKRSDKSDIDEYAFAAGVTSIGVRGKDSVCVVTQKVLPDNLLDPTSVTHLFQVTKFLGLLATDTTADARQLVQQARNVAAKFRFNYGFEMPVDALARWIEGTSQVGVVTMVLGIDDGNGPKLFKCDPAGHFFGHKATSAGWKELEAINLLEKKMKNDPEFSYDETVQTAISALQSVLQEDLKANEIEVGVVRKENPAFHVLSTEEIDEHLTAISERD